MLPFLSEGTLGVSPGNLKLVFEDPIYSYKKQKALAKLISIAFWLIMQTYWLCSCFLLWVFSIGKKRKKVLSMLWINKQNSVMMSIHACVMTLQSPSIVYVCACFTVPLCAYSMMQPLFFYFFYFTIPKWKTGILEPYVKHKDYVQNHILKREQPCSKLLFIYLNKHFLLKNMAEGVGSNEGVGGEVNGVG